MIKGIFWDNDGILVIRALYFRATMEVLARFGIELTQQQLSTSR
jgi:beta-phosphoglucomutase-like phosphatase (HAD superfamily)